MESTVCFLVPLSRAMFIQLKVADQLLSSNKNQLGAEDLHKRIYNKAEDYPSTVNTRDVAAVFQ